MNAWKSLLVPPGAGVFTVSSGSELKNSLWKEYYQSTTIDDVYLKWSKQLAAMDLSNHSPNVFACPSDTGAGIIKGSNWGPLFLRQALIDSIPYHWDKIDLGDIKVNPHLLNDELLTTIAINHLQKQMYPDVKDQNVLATLPVSPLSQIDFLTKNIWQQYPHKKFLFLAGDHSCSYPIVKNWCLSRKHKNFAVLHFDAHTDLLEQRLGIAYCFGTWAYHILPYLPSSEHLLQIGIRASSKTQDDWEKKLKIKQIWSKEIRENNPEQTANAIVQYYKKLGVEEIYISFDVDVLDPKYLSCTGTAEPNGLYPHHVACILNEIKKEFLVSCIDVVEFAPFIKQPTMPLAQLEPDTSMLTLKTLMPLFWNCL